MTQNHKTKSLSFIPQFRIVLLNLLTGAVLLLCAGCGDTASVPADETILVTDQLGRDARLQKNPSRIISSYYVSTAMLIALGAQDKIVGVEQLKRGRNLYQRTGVAKKFNRTTIVGSGKGIDIEACLSLDPDLIIIPFRLQEAIPKLEEAGLAVIAVMPENLELFLECVTLLGKATGRQERAAEFRDFYEEHIRKINAITEGLAYRPSVYIAGHGNPLITVTGQMHQTDMIEIAGGRSVSAELADGYWTAVSAEQLILWNPEYIFPVRYAAYRIADIINDERLATIRATRTEGRIYRFPSSLEPWDFPTPSSLLGVLWLAGKLHPELYPLESYAATAREFYKKFFNIAATDDEIGL